MIELKDLDNVSFDDWLNLDGTLNVHKMSCPVCGNREFIELLYTFYVCPNCKALVDYTPFGLKLVSNDATIRFPEVKDML